MLGWRRFRTICDFPPSRRQGGGPQNHAKHLNPGGNLEGYIGIRGGQNGICSDVRHPALSTVFLDASAGQGGWIPGKSE